MFCSAFWAYKIHDDFFSFDSAFWWLTLVFILIYSQDDFTQLITHTNSLSTSHTYQKNSNLVSSLYWVEVCFAHICHTVIFFNIHVFYCLSVLILLVHHSGTILLWCVRSSWQGFWLWHCWLIHITKPIFLLASTPVELMEKWCQVRSSKLENFMHLFSFSLLFTLNNFIFFCTSIFSIKLNPTLNVINCLLFIVCSGKTKLVPQLVSLAC